MADLTPIPMGIPWDPWDPSFPHSHAHLYVGPVADELKHNLFIMRNRDATALLLITTSDNDGVQFCGVFCQ